MDVDQGSGNGVDLGALLRASRSRRGEDLRQVATALRIRFVYLEAIEEGRFEDLPGTTYAIGFLKTYSEYLGLDSEEIVRRYKSEETNPVKKPDLIFPIVVPEHGIPGGAVVMVGLLIAAVGYGGWYFLSTRDAYVTEAVPPLPENLATLVEPDRRDNSSRNSLVEASSAVAAPAQRITPNLAPVQRAPTEQPVQPVTSSVETAQARLVPVQNQTVIPAPATSQTTAEVAPQMKLSPADENVSPETVVPNTATKEISEPLPDEPVIEQAAAPENEPATQVATTTDPTPAVESIANKAETASSGDPAPAAMNTETSDPTDAGDPMVQSDPVTVVADSQAEVPQTPTPVETAESAPASQVSAQPDPVQAAFDDRVPGIQLKPRAPAETVTSSTEVASLPEQPQTATDGASRITLHAKQASWIQVRDAVENTLVMSKVLLKGHSYQVPNRSGLSLMTGNAGALEISVDGQPVPTIGGPGVVRQNVSLDADKLRQGTAISE